MPDRKLTIPSPSWMDGGRQGSDMAGSGIALVGKPFVSALRSATGAGWSGILELSSVNQPVAGTVVLDSGHVAWATSIGQPETLGSFLQRLGHVSQDDLDITQALYEEAKGEKKLGRLMEEAGIIPRQVLRRCLLLHVRLAIACLVQSKLKVTSARAGQLCVAREMLFSVAEVLPEWRSAPPPGALPTGPGDAVTVVLESLKTIPGHRGCLVADRGGTTISVCGFSSNDIPGPSVLATTAVALLEGASHAATWCSLGNVDHASSEGAAGALLAHWLDKKRSLLAAVLLDPTGKIGVARYELTAAASAFSRHETEPTRDGS